MTRRWGTRRFAGLTAAAFLVLLTHPEGTMANVRCPSQTGPVVDVQINGGQPSLRTDVGLSGLARMRGDDTRVETIAGQPVGLTRGRIQVDAQLRRKYRKRDHDVCMRAERARITLNLDQTVFIAHQIGRGTCGWSVVRQHEQRHVKADRRVLRGNRTWIRRYVRDALRQLGPVRARSVERANRIINDHLQSAIEHLSQRLKRARQDAHGRIDTKETYTRLTRKCPEQFRRLKAARD